MMSLDPEMMEKVTGGVEQPEIDWARVPSTYQEQWEQLFNDKYAAEKAGDREALGINQSEFEKLTDFLTERYGKEN